ncbi:hypothetical protein O6P43_018162 [Quillaja saponaria]|uniref:Uncharacterized protein n=1 Tax=Quillaja saponaria TaxID=32244 RepID=A0AAD7PPD8_QUISA|nr:hypothetical protein O6P43_018162 [Quillaja saponaria]
MRRAYEFAYDPEVVTIGPFHYKKERQELLTVTEQHKIQFLFRSPYMHSQTSDEKEVRLGKLAEEMKKLEERTRCCYSEAFADICSDDFVRMMVLDGCLILHLFHCWDHNRQFYQEFASGSLLRERWIVPAIGMDLVKLENQLPFFVLQKLYQLTRPIDNEQSLLTLASEFLQSLSLKAEKLPTESYPQHLLALYHSMFEPLTGSRPSHGTQKSSDQEFLIPRAKELIYHGIQIRKGNEQRLLEIKHGQLG